MTIVRAVPSHDNKSGLGIFTQGDDGRFTATKISTGTSGLRDMAVVDFDGDQRPEIFIGQATTSSKLYKASGSGWTNVSGAAGLTAETGGSSGAAVGDLDNDGDQDIVTVHNGAALGLTFWLNDGEGHFTTEHYTEPSIRGKGIGVVTGDFDGNGSLDRLFGTGGGAPDNLPSAGEYIYLTGEENDNNWVTISLKGTVSEKSGLGARVCLTTPDGKTQLLEQDSGAHGWMQDPPNLHFGLGDNASARIRVVWPDGYQQTQTVSTNRLVVVEERRGIMTFERDGDTVHAVARSSGGTVRLDGSITVEDGFEFSNLQRTGIEANDRLTISPGEIDLRLNVVGRGTDTFSFDVDPDAELTVAGDFLYDFI